MSPFAGVTIAAGSDATREALPAGTITFLFTDIEGSTRLLARLGERYAAVLSDHQRLLRETFADSWPAGVHLRVRMGLHTGEPAATQDRYIGLSVHRAARICAAGHGGQVLLSRATYAILADDVLPDLAFHDLGEHSLKDIDHAERIYQLLVPDLPRHFPPLRTVSQ